MPNDTPPVGPHLLIDMSAIVDRVAAGVYDPAYGLSRAEADELSRAIRGAWGFGRDDLIDFDELAWLGSTKPGAEDPERLLRDIRKNVLRLDVDPVLAGRTDIVAVNAERLAWEFRNALLDWWKEVGGAVWAEGIEVEEAGHGKEIDAWRDRMGFTMEEASRHVGVSKSTLKAMKRGDKQRYSGANLERVLRTIGEKNGVS